MNTKTLRTFEFNGITFEVDGLQSNEYRDRNKKPRVYMRVPDSMEPDWTQLDALAEKLGAASRYTQRGEYPELDQLWDKLNKELVVTYRKVLERALEWSPFTAQDAKFSRKAGCSCGCSPGFVLKDGQRGYDLWISPAQEK